jgi:PKD repeat protein
MKRFVCMIILAAAMTASATTIYFIGNSVTDVINYGALQKLAQSRGHTHQWGRTMIPGAPLDWFVQHPTDGITEAPYGIWTNALPNYAWDFISLQPFDRLLADDISAIGTFADLAKAKSAGKTLIIYERWPRSDNHDASSAKGWNDAFMGPFTGGWDNSNETRDYFEQLTTRAKTAQPGFRVILAPVGEVMHQLNIKMSAGQVPGYSHIWQVYADGIHLNGAGAYIACCTYFATIYQEDPTGLGVPSDFGSLNSTYVQIVQQTVWDVIRNYKDSGGNPWSGMSGGGTTVAVTGVKLSLDSVALTTGQTATLTTTVQPTNATNKTVSWSSSASNIASVSTSGVVTGQAAGTATITVTTQDGGKTAQCRVRVTSGTAVTGVTVSPTADTVLVGQTITLTATVSPANATDKSVVWSSSDTSCATVNQSGVVTGKKLGAVTITVTTVSGGKTATCAVTVSIIDTPPIAVINATPQSGMAPLTVSFDGTGSHDPDTGDFVLGYDWNFGDGSVASSNSATHTYRNPGTYIVKLVAMDSRQVRGDTARVTITVTANPNAPVLISQGKTAVASSEENSQYAGYLPATNVTDGNTATRWASNTTDNEWIYIDLGSSQSFDRIVLLWEVAYASSYKLQTSTDAQTWTDIYSTTTGDGGADTIDVKASGRYVRMLGVARATQYGYSLWEFEIFQIPGVTALKPALSARTVPGSTATRCVIMDVVGRIVDGHGAPTRKGGFARGAYVVRNPATDRKATRMNIVVK